jgi:hypothetical protein
VARRSGGYLDTITATTGVLIPENDLNVPTIVETLTQALSLSWDEQLLRQHAQRFSRAAHWAALQALIPGL